MFCRLYSTVVVSVVVLGQLFSISRSKSGDLKDLSEIFLEYHTAVVTVVTYANTGTGFSIETPQNYSVAGTENKSRFVVTASHVVKGAYWVDLYIYQNEKDTEGNWKKDICSATIYGLDISRDVALLEIACDTCNCKRLGTLQTRLSTVNEEKIFVIGNSGKTRPHSFIRGSLSSTNITFSPASLNYKLDNDIAATAFVSRVHGLTGSLNFGDAGSAVMAKTGDVIGMILGRSGDHNFCVTMEEISKAYEQMLDTISPSFVACTARESAFLGRKYWGHRSGKSIKEMNALATAMDAQYFAVAHDETEAHAFTFDFLWWEILPENYFKEHSSQCRCETNSFTDSKFLERRVDGKDMCGCAGSACRRLEYYEKRFGEDNDRRWAVYKRMSKNPDKSRHYVPSEESLALMKNIAGEIDYWKKKVVNSRGENELLVSMMINIKEEQNTWTTKLKEKDVIISCITTGIAVVVCVASGLVTCYYKRWRNTERKLRKACTQRDRLNERLSQQQELQNPIAAPTQESNELTDGEDGQLC